VIPFAEPDRRAQRVAAGPRLPWLFAGALWASDTQLRKREACALAAIFIVLMAGNYSGRLIDVIYAKGAYRDPQMG